MSSIVSEGKTGVVSTYPHSGVVSSYPQLGVVSGVGIFLGSTVMWALFRNIAEISRMLRAREEKEQLEAESRKTDKEVSDAKGLLDSYEDLTGKKQKGHSDN